MNINRRLPPKLSADCILCGTASESDSVATIGREFSTAGQLGPCSGNTASLVGARPKVLTNDALLQKNWTRKYLDQHKNESRPSHESCWFEEFAKLAKTQPNEELFYHLCIS
jgi:hypothetical protein